MTSKRRRYTEAFKRELEITRQERDIPQKAVAIFSQPKRSGSSSSLPTEPNSW